MSVCFDAINIHGLLFNAFIKISYVFVGGRLLFLQHAHLPWEMRGPRSLSKLVSHALDSKMTQNLLTVSFLKCSRVICWKVTAHLLQFSVTILWQNVYWCHFSYCDWLQPAQGDFLEHSLTAVALELSRHYWHPLCASERQRRMGFRELSWTWRCIKAACWALFMGNSF